MWRWKISATILVEKWWNYVKGAIEAKKIGLLNGKWKKEEGARYLRGDKLTLKRIYVGFLLKILFQNANQIGKEENKEKKSSHKWDMVDERKNAEVKLWRSSGILNIVALLFPCATPDREKSMMPLINKDYCEEPVRWTSKVFNGHANALTSKRKSSKAWSQPFIFSFSIYNYWLLPKQCIKGLEDMSFTMF